MPMLTLPKCVSAFLDIEMALSMRGRPSTAFGAAFLLKASILDNQNSLASLSCYSKL